MRVGLEMSETRKNNKHKHFGWDGVQDKQEPSLRQMGPILGTNRDPSLGQIGRSLFNSKVESSFCPVCDGLSLGRVLVRPWDHCLARAVSKILMCYVFIGLCV